MSFPDRQAFLVGNTQGHAFWATLPVWQTCLPVKLATESSFPLWQIMGPSPL